VACAAKKSLNFSYLLSTAFTTCELKLSAGFTMRFLPDEQHPSDSFPAIPVLGTLLSFQGLLLLLRQPTHMYQLQSFTLEAEIT